MTASQHMYVMIILGKYNTHESELVVTPRTGAELSRETDNAMYLDDIETKFHQGVGTVGSFFFLANNTYKKDRKLATRCGASAYTPRPLSAAAAAAAAASQRLPSRPAAYRPLHLAHPRAVLALPFLENAVLVAVGVDEGGSCRALRQAAVPGRLLENHPPRPSLHEPSHAPHCAPATRAFVPDMTRTSLRSSSPARLTVPQPRSRSGTNPNPCVINFENPLINEEEQGASRERLMCCLRLRSHSFRERRGEGGRLPRPYHVLLARLILSHLGIPPIVLQPT